MYNSSHEQSRSLCTEHDWTVIPISDQIPRTSHLCRWDANLTCTTPGPCHSSCRRSASPCRPLARQDESVWTPARLWSLLSSRRLWWRSATFYSQTLDCSWGDWACRSWRCGVSKEVFGRPSAEVPRRRSAARRTTGTSGRAGWRLHRPGRAGSWASDHLTFAWWYRRGRARCSTGRTGKGRVRTWMFLWAGVRREQVERGGARMPSLHGHEQRMIFLSDL